MNLKVVFTVNYIFKVLLNAAWDFPLSGMFFGLYLFHFGLIASYGYHLFGGRRGPTR